MPEIGEGKVKRPYNRHVNVDNSKEILSENIILPTQNVDKVIENIVQKEIVEVVKIKEVIIENNYLINVKRKFSISIALNFLLTLIK